MEKIAVYCGSKAAALMFSKVLGKELAPRGVRVNVLSPSGTNTEIFDGLDIDRSVLMPSADVARIALMLTELPESLDILEVMPFKRLAPL